MSINYHKFIPCFWEKWDEWEGNAHREQDRDDFLMCAHQHPIQARPGGDCDPGETTCYVTGAVDEAVLIQIRFKRAWFKSASLCYVTGHLLRLGTVINIWLRHNFFAWFHMFRCNYVERWMRYWLGATQNGSIRYAHFIDGIPEIPIPAPYEGKVEDTVNFETNNCFSCANEMVGHNINQTASLVFLWGYEQEPQSHRGSLSPCKRIQVWLSVSAWSFVLDNWIFVKDHHVIQLKIKPVHYSTKHPFPLSSIPVLVLTARHTASLFCLFSFRMWLYMLRYNSNQYFQAKRSMLHMDIKLIR